MRKRCCDWHTKAPMTPRLSETDQWQQWSESPPLSPYTGKALPIWGRFGRNWVRHQCPVCFSLALRWLTHGRTCYSTWFPLSLISPTGESEGSSPTHHLDSSTLAEETLAGGNNSAACRVPLATPVAQGSALPGERGKFPPSSGVNGSLGLARDRLNLAAVALPPRVA